MMPVPRQAYLDRAIKQNNIAVSLIETGHYESVTNGLSKTLQICRDVLGHESAADGWWTGRPVTTSLDQCMEESRGGDHAYGGEFGKHKNKTEDDELENEYFLYDQAIRIPMNAGSNRTSAVLVSAIATFNLALSLHLTANGGEQGGDNTKKLRKAARLYETGFQLLFEDDSVLDSNDLFVLATVNNLGLVYWQLNERRTANKCFEYVLSTLMYLTDSYDYDQGYPFESDGFFRNITAIISKPCSAPAA